MALVAPVAAFHYKETQGPATLEVRCEPLERPAIALADVLRVVITLDGSKDAEVDGPVRLIEGAAWYVVESPSPRARKSANCRTSAA